MACHTPPLNKVKKQGEMPLLSLGPIPLIKKSLEFRGYYNESDVILRKKERR